MGFSSTVRLYVGNLPYSIDQTGLAAVFSEFGLTALKPQIIMDKVTGRPKGFAFVEMGSREEADRAIAEIDGYRVEGRPIRVSIANERPGRGGGGSNRSAPTSERRGGGGGGGGGGKREARGRHRDDDVWR